MPQELLEFLQALSEEQKAAVKAFVVSHTDVEVVVALLEAVDPTT